MDFNRTSNSLCFFKVQWIALNSPGSLKNSLSLFAVTPGSETGRFIWFYKGTEELLCSTAPFPLNGLCDKANFGDVEVPGLLDQSTPFATPCGEWKPQDWLYPHWKVVKALITPGTYKSQIYGTDLCIIKNSILFAPKFSLMLRSQCAECCTQSCRQGISMNTSGTAVCYRHVQGHISSFQVAQLLWGGQVPWEQHNPSATGKFQEAGCEQGRMPEGWPWQKRNSTL